MSDAQQSQILSKAKISSSSIFDLINSSLLINLLSLALPITMMQIYDRIIQFDAKETLTVLILGCISAILLETIIRYFRNQLSQLLSTRFEYKANSNAVQKIVNSQLDEFEKKAPNTYIEQLMSIQTLKNFHSGQFYQMIIDLPFSLIFLYAIYYLGGILVLFPIALFSLYFFSIFIIRKIYEATHNDHKEINEKRSSFIINLLNNLNFIKTNTLEEQHLQQYENLTRKDSRSLLNYNFWKNLPEQIGSSFGLLCTFGTILAGSFAVLEGSMTIGGLTACMMLTSRAMQPIQQAANYWFKSSDAIKAMIDLHEIESLTQDKINYSGTKVDIEGKLSFKNLCLLDSQSNVIFDQINLDIPSRSMVGITGPSKTGSSNFLILATGLLRPSEGEILIDEKNIDEYSNQSLEGKIQYIGDHGVLYKGSILDNLTSFNHHKQAVALNTAQFLGLDPLIAPLPQGYETMVDSKSKISRDIIHRICIARAFVTRPRILLLDKITANMDGRSEQLFLKLLEQLQGYCTILLVTQWPLLLDKCDAVYELKNGHLEAGNHHPERRRTS